MQGNGWVWSALLGKSVLYPPLAWASFGVVFFALYLLGVRHLARERR